jgi:hypothetical protein
MDPLTIDDLYWMIGQLNAQILQLQRHVAKLEPAPKLEVVAQEAEL